MTCFIPFVFFFIRLLKGIQEVFANANLWYNSYQNLKYIFQAPQKLGYLAVLTWSFSGLECAPAVGSSVKPSLEWEHHHHQTAE